MAKLQLKIVTPEKQIYDGEVDQVNVSTTDGEIGILPNHISLMSRLKPGELQIKTSGKSEVMVIGDGFLQVKNNVLTIMADLAQDVEDIDEKAVEQAKERAEAALAQKLSDEEQAETLAILERSVAQLNIKRRHRSHRSV